MKVFVGRMIGGRKSKVVEMCRQRTETVGLVPGAGGGGKSGARWYFPLVVQCNAPRDAGLAWAGCTVVIGTTISLTMHITRVTEAFLTMMLKLVLTALNYFCFCFFSFLLWRDPFNRQKAHADESERTRERKRERWERFVKPGLKPGMPNTIQYCTVQRK